MEARDCKREGEARVCKIVCVRVWVCVRALAWMQGRRRKRYRVRHY